MDPNSAWPDERLSIFSMPPASADSPTWCSLQWLSGFSMDEGDLAGHFKRAGDLIIDSLRGEKELRHPDGLFMPVAYNYRHSLELMLKHIVRVGLAAGLIQDAPAVTEVLSTHALASLWSYARFAIQKRWPDGDRKTVTNTEALINDFQRIDRSGQNLRYTRNRAGRSTLERYPPAIELATFQDAYTGIFNLLKACASDFSEIADYNAESQRGSSW